MNPTGQPRDGDTGLADSAVVGYGGVLEIYVTTRHVQFVQLDWLRLTQEGRQGARIEHGNEYRAARGTPASTD